MSCLKSRKLFNVKSAVESWLISLFGKTVYDVCWSWVTDGWLHTKLVMYCVSRRNQKKSEGSSSLINQLQQMKFFFSTDDITFLLQMPLVSSFLQNKFIWNEERNLPNIHNIPCIKASTWKDSPALSALWIYEILSWAPPSTQPHYMVVA